MCTEHVYTEERSEGSGRSTKLRLTKIPLGLTAKANPRISQS